MGTQPQHHRSTRQSIQARLPEHHTYGQAHQNRAGCKRQHVIGILYGFARCELRHRFRCNDDDDAVRRESAPPQTRRQLCPRPPIPSRRRPTARRSHEMEDHATTRRPHTIRAHRDQAMPIHQARVIGRWGRSRQGCHSSEAGAVGGRYPLIRRPIPPSDPHRIQSHQEIPRTPRRPTCRHRDPPVIRIQQLLQFSSHTLPSRAVPLTPIRRWGAEPPL